MSHISVENHVASFDLHDLSPRQREVAVFAAGVLIPVQPWVDSRRVTGFRLPLAEDTPATHAYLEQVDAALEESLTA